MKTQFKKIQFNEKFDNKEKYINMFSDLGFETKKIVISFVNGISAYITLNVKVLNENKMYADVFVYNKIATITIRISDHISNLEKICGGVSGNKMSFNAFKDLLKNEVIINN